MKLEKDDPRLLQYVLDEISPHDRQAVEAAIFNQSEISAEVDSLKRLYGEISQVEQQPTQLRLSVERRQKLFEQTIDKKPFSGLISNLRNWRYVAGGLVAATFALMVFTHSLKNEVKEQAVFKQPKIPADSDLSTSATLPPPTALHAVEPESVAKVKTESTTAIAEGSGKDSESEAKNEELYSDPPQLAAQQAAPSKPSINVQTESRAVLREDLSKDFIENKMETAKKKMFAASKSGSPIKTAPSASITALSKELETSNSDLPSTFGASGKQEKLEDKTHSFGAAAPKGRGIISSTGPFQVLISSRALESEQIKTMTAFVTNCLNKSKVEREIKIAYQPQEKKYEITNANPSLAEKKFADCAQQAFVQPLAPYIKTIYVELKTVP